MGTYGRILTWALALTVAPAATALTPEDLLEVRWISAPALSPDARLVAYTVTEDRMEPEVSDTVTQVWLSAVDGSATARPFTTRTKSPRRR